MKQHNISLQPLGKNLRVNDETPLIDVLHEFGIEFPCGGKGTCGKCKVKLISGNIGLTALHRQKLEALKLSDEWRLACYSHCTEDLTLEIDQFNHLILADETEFDFEPTSGFGIAVDLGTTTLVTQLVDLATARVVAAETMINPQVRFGADVISRIQAYLDGHSSQMTQLIRNAIGGMIDRLLEKQHTSILRIDIVGNTTMQLIFCGGNLASLAQYPFETNDLGQKEFSSSELGWSCSVEEKIRFHASIGSFVGSDILAGIAATGMHRKEEYTALVDLGTNGEIALGNRHHIVCSSTAAGPAFEGTNISMGMRAATGAISSVSLSGSTISQTTIGNISPKGICGSALVDAIAIFRKLELVGPFGEIASGDGDISVTERIRLTQKDIFEFLLAKAAIAAGLEILCKTLNIVRTDIQHLYIAGGFGNYINIKHLTDTGIVELPEEKIHKMGNTALIGAKMFLFTKDEVVSDILSNISHVNLESNPYFQNIYIDKMTFC